MKLLIKFFHKYHLKLVVVFLFICTLCYSFIAISSHNHFQTFAWDMGYFDQLIFKLSRGIYPYSTLSKVNILAGHFAPILVIFAPLYWIKADPRMLLVAQSFIVVFASLPLYLLSLKLTKHILFSFSVLFSYLFFLGTQWSILNEFHEATIVPILLSFIFYALEKKIDWLFWISVIGLFATKEEMALLVSAISLTVWLYFKRKKVGIALLLFSVIFFFFLTNIFMPAISEKGVYQHIHLSHTAKSPSDFVLKLVSDPLFGLKSMVTPPEKILTLVVSFLSFGTLPLFAPISILIPLIQQFLLRFLYTGPQFTLWQNVNHHAAPASMLLAISTIYAATLLAKKYKKSSKKVFLCASFILLIAGISQDIIFKAPIHSLLKKQLYETQDWIKDNYKILDSAQKISSDIPVAAQNSMLPHLSKRKEIYLLPEIDSAKYIIIDLQDGPNKFAPLDKRKMEELVDSLVDSKEFVIEQQIGKAMLLKRKNL